jgi:deoxyribose-phosphate aldolase
MKNLAHFIDHTNLSPDAKSIDIEDLCSEAIKYDFASVCLNPVYVPIGKSILKDSKPIICSVVGFPLGADSAEMKYAEARFLIFNGVEEIDMVLNIGALKERNTNIIQKEIKKVVDAAEGKIVKVIIETCLLNNHEKVLASKIVRDCGANLVKTSTAWCPGGGPASLGTLSRTRLQRDMTASRGVE